MGQACHECEGNSRRIWPVAPGLLEGAQPYPQVLALDNEEVLSRAGSAPCRGKRGLDVVEHLSSLSLDIAFANYGAGRFDQSCPPM